MYQAKVIRIMIASPTDVAEERRAVREIVHRWTDIHSEDKELVLLPMGWETHSHPTMGARPQAFVNKQVLEKADILVAIFWTRLGTPTGVADSGTVEEIEEFIKAGKPTMIYFSGKPVHPDSVNPEQYAALLAFRNALQQRGLIERYDSSEEFREKFSCHLAQKMISDFGSSGSAKLGTFAAAPLPYSMSETARRLLLAAASDGYGRVIHLRTMGGLILEANGTVFAEAGNPRSEAEGESAVRELQMNGLLEAVGNKKEISKVTAEGFRVADDLRAASGQSAT